MISQSLPRSDQAMPWTWLERGLALLIIVTFVTGGGSQGHGLGDVLAQLLALPVLVVALQGLFRQPSHDLRRAAIAVAALTVAIAALQLLPIPAGLWAWPPARAALLRDLHAVGVGQPESWTLTPAATEQAMWSLLPALAAFFSALCLADQAHRRLSWLFVALVFSSLVLGLIQLGLPQDSLLNPFPQWTPAFGGVFANPNHQASALILGAVLASGLWLDRRAARTGRGSHWQSWVLAACGLVFLAALPLTDSRAGLLIAGPALMCLMLATGVLTWRTVGATRLSRIGAVGAVGVTMVSGYVALSWFQISVTDEDRWPMALATSALARELWPLGAGFGSFVPWFEQAGPDALLLGEYINHAHNEYLQWWLEGGAPAMVVLAAALVVLALVLRTLLRKEAAPLGLAAWIGVAVLLASSLVDYPLRTAALMTMGAWLAGMAVAQASRNSGCRLIMKVAKPLPPPA